MKKIISLLSNNSLRLIGTLLVSIFFAFSAFPNLINLEFVKNFLDKFSIGHLIGLTAFVLFGIILFWEKSRNLWQRYKNTYAVENPPFVHLDYIFSFIFFSFLLIVLFQTKYLPSQSVQFELFTIINFVLIVLWFLSSYFWEFRNKKEEPFNMTSFPLSDEPIQFDVQDFLGRGKFIEDLYGEIASIPFGDSFVFGLHGSWGEGKTSIINMLRNKFKNNEDFLIVNFDPWHFRNEKAVLSAFYRQVERAISEKFIFPNIKRLFIKYEKIISSGISYAGIRFDFPFKDEGLEKIKQRIESYIRGTKKKILVFIDDIDRLQPHEILLIFNLVRLNAKFRNTIFLLSFDQIVVQNYLKENLSADPEFLEKIVQKPVPLPAIEQVYVDQFLDICIDGSVNRSLILDMFRKYKDADWKKIFKDPGSEIIHFMSDLQREDFEFITDPRDKIKISLLWNLAKNNLFDTIGINIGINKEEKEKFEKDLSYIYQTQIKKLFRTLRHVKRYINGLRSTLPPIRNEVNLHDFFILEVIRIFYPRVYDDIWRNPWFYIPVRWSDATFFLAPFSFLEDDEKNALIKDHVESILKNETQGEILRALLEAIFFVEVKNALSQSRTDHSGVAASYREEKRITHPESFRKYFMLKVSPLEIPDEFVETTLKLWHSAKKNVRGSIVEETIFELQGKDKLLEFFKKLMIFKDRIQKEVALEIIKVIYKNAGKLSKKGRENFWNSEYGKGESLMLWLINDKVDKGKIEETLEKAILNSPHIPFAVEVVLSCKKERGGLCHNIYDSIKIEKLQNKIAERLKKYFVDKNRDIFKELREESDWGFVLYLWGTNWMTFRGSNNRVVNRYVLSLIRQNSKKFARFLMRQRKRTDPRARAWTFDLEEFSKTYNLVEFQKIANKFRNDTSLTLEEKETIRIFLEKIKGWKEKQK